ncbi:MAG: type II CAAX endopeptidase family protein [Planctomycetota bacterium]
MSDFNPYEPNDATFATDDGSPESVSKPIRPRVWPIVLVVPLSLLIFFAASGVAIAIGYVIATGNIDKGIAGQDAMKRVLSSRPGFLVTVVLPQLALMMPAVIAAWFSPEPFRKRLSLTRGHWPLWAWVAAALTTPVIGWISSILVGSLMSESENLQRMSDVFRQFGANGFMLPLAFVIGMTPAVCEELLFRGYVQTRLNRRIGPAMGILLSSFLFAAFHMDPIHCIAVFPLGVYLGVLTWRSGSLFPAMLAHFVNNAISVVAVVIGPESMDDAVSLEMVLFIFIVGVIGLASGAFTMIALWMFAPSASSTLTNPEDRKVQRDEPETRG